MAEAVVPILINAAVSYAISYVLAPEGQDVEGPRLDDRGVQRNSYGTPIGIIYGTILTAGSLVWLENNELKETTNTESQGGKGGGGGGSVTTYTYSFSGAIAICEGEINGVEKVWADTTLLYDANPDTGQVTGLTGLQIAAASAQYPFNYAGGGIYQDQWDDETADKGVANVPAYRGTAMHYITDMQLADYGNRVPNFSYKVNGRYSFLSQGYGPLQLRELGDLPVPLIDETYAGSVDDGRFAAAWSSAGISGRYIINSAHSTSDDAYDFIYRRTVAVDGAVSLFVEATSALPRQAVAPASFTFAYSNPKWGLASSNTARQSWFLYNGTDVLHEPVDDGANSSYIASGDPDDSAYGTYLVNRDYVNFWFEASADWLFLVEWGHNNDKLIVNKYAQSGTPFPVQVLDLSTQWSTAAKAQGASQMQIRYVNGSLFVLDFGSDPCKAYEYDEFFNLQNAYTFDSVGGTGNNANITPNKQWLLNFNSSKAMLFKLGTPSTVIWESAAAEYQAEFVSSDRRLDIRWISDRVFTEGYRLWEFYGDADGAGAGEAGGANLKDVVEDLCTRAGIALADIDASELDGTIVNGYSVKDTTSLRTSLEPLMIAYQFDPFEDDYKLVFRFRDQTPIVTVTEDELRPHLYATDSGDYIEIEQIEESKLPRRININYLNLETDYEPDTQFAERSLDAVDSRQVSDVDLGMSFTPEQAIQIADKLLREAWVGRVSYKFGLPKKYSFLSPNDVVTLNMDDYTVDVRLAEVGVGVDGRVACVGVQHKSSSYTSTATTDSPENNVPAVPQIKDTLQFAVMDTNLFESGAALPSGKHPLYVAGWAKNWRGYSVQQSTDSGVTWQTLGQFQENAATMGMAMNALGTPPAEFLHQFDDRDSLTVRLFSSDMELSSKTDTQVLGGSNIFAVGAVGRWEIIGAATVTQVDSYTYTLTRLLRGLRGTEGNIGTMALYDRVVLLTPTTVRSVAMLDDSIGNTIRIRPFYDPGFPNEDEEFSVVLSGNPLREFAPSNIFAFWKSTGDITISWTRRTRISGEWRNGQDAYLAGDSRPEEYTLKIYDATTSPYTLARTVTGLSSSTSTYTSAQRTTDGTTGLSAGEIYVTVTQVDQVVGDGYLGGSLI